MLLAQILAVSSLVAPCDPGAAPGIYATIHWDGTLVLESLIYDWNKIGAPARPPRVMLDDETLRDGLQSPSVTDPQIEEKVGIGPDKVRDYLAIVGDSSDNVPGLKGVGPVGAARTTTWKDSCGCSSFSTMLPPTIENARSLPAPSSMPER